MLLYEDHITASCMSMQSTQSHVVWLSTFRYAKCYQDSLCFS